METIIKSQSLEDLKWLNDFDLLFKTVANQVYHRLKGLNLLNSYSFDYILINIVEGTLFLLKYK
jgi:hypothetical protein